MPKSLDPAKQVLVEALLRDPLLAHVSTANPKNCQPHLTLVWYWWDGQSIWISGFASTRKFRELSANPRCAILIEPANPKESKLQAALFEGQAEIVRQPRALVEEVSTKIYLRYLGEEGIQAADPQSWIHDPENLVAKLTPERIYTW